VLAMHAGAVAVQEDGLILRDVPSRLQAAAVLGRHISRLLSSTFHVAITG
jgi:hypothetical protein